MTRKSITTLLLTVLFSLAFTQSSIAASPDELDELRAELASLRMEVAQLRLEVNSLKAQVAANKPANALPAAKPGKPIMLVESVSEADRDVSHLIEEAQTLESEAAQAKQRAIELRAEPRRVGSRAQSPPLHLNDQERQDWKLEHKRQEADLKSAAARSESEARKKTTWAARVRRDAAEPWQVIHGWDGNTFVKLTTTTNMASRMPKIGTYINWEGRMIEASDGIERWEIRSWKAVSEPKDFRSRGGG